MSELLIRVCPEHQYPVGLLNERPEFICLSTFHRIEIEETIQIEFAPIKKEISILNKE